MMYEELVKELRLACDDERYGGKYLYLSLINRAADAIEELANWWSMAKTLSDMVMPKWIPVTERLPSENDRYLTVSIEPWFGATVVDTMRWSGVWMYDGRQTEATVTHWMPLPMPPKEK